MQKPTGILVFALVLHASAAFGGDRYPPRWWAPAPEAGKPSWEILPQAAKPPRVIVSKRNDLGLLSNFAATPFELDGQRYGSVEGLWQSMIYPEGPDDPRSKAGPWPHTRAEVSAMTAFEAKKAGGEAWKILKPLGIGWLSYRGERLDYKGKDKEKHYQIIRRAMEAKLQQNRSVRDVLLATGELELLPDHDQGKNITPAYEYTRIWMDLRTRLRAEERAMAETALAHWSPENRARILAGVEAALAHPKRAAVFDGDGTLWHADIPREFLEWQVDQRHLKHFDYSEDGKQAGERLYGTCRSDVSICIAQAAYLHVGLSLDELQKHMDGFFAGFAPKIFRGQQELIEWLRERGFNVYVVSGGPKWLAEYPARKWFGIPPENVIGVRTKIVEGVITAEIVPPLPFRDGKMKAIKAAIPEEILVASGNTGSDVPMLELSQQLAIGINSFGPETKGFHYKAEQELIKEAAKRNWLMQKFEAPRN